MRYNFLNADKVYKIIKDAQQQHGLRREDYQQYRGYCTRRLQRLRSVLKVPQGDKRHFKRRDVHADIVTEDKFLQIPLMMAERAWSYAMQLRQESNTEPRKKFHLIARLRKAATYALQLQELIESVNCDARTKLEAQAYVAWIHGSLHFELQQWKPARENLKKAQVVYEKLASALPEPEQAMYKARVEEFEHNLRFCAYNIGDTSDIDDLVQMRGQLSGELLASLDTLIVQTRAKQTKAEEVTWRGKSCGIAPPRAAGLLLANSQLDQTLAKASSEQAKIDLLEAHLIDCKDTIAATRELFKNEQRNKDGDKSSAQHLISYLQYIRMSRTLERNLALIEAAEKSEKAKPQDIVRLYEAVLHNLVEISQLQEDEEFQAEQNAKTMVYRAFRCYYLAQSLTNLRRWRDAVALYQRSSEHAEEALKQQSLLSDDMKKSASELKKSIEGAQYAVHAHSVLEEDQEEEVGVNSRQSRSQKLLLDHLHEYREDPSLISKHPNVYKLPPPMEAIPCKPLFFDLAFNMVEFPDLTEKMQDPSQKSGPGLTGLVKGLWGWGNK